MPSASKLLTPQWRILPARCSASNASTVSASGTAPGQCSRYRSIVSTPRRRRLASHDARHGAARGVVRIDLADQEDRVAPAARSPRRPAASERPSPYISAVSIRVSPSSMPRRRAGDLLRGAWRDRRRCSRCPGPARARVRRRGACVACRPLNPASRALCALAQQQDLPTGALRHGVQQRARHRGGVDGLQVVGDQRRQPPADVERELLAAP